MHHIAPTRYQSKENLMESKVITMLEHVNHSLQMFNQIELPENYKPLEQAFNILESNLNSIKDYMKTPNCPDETIESILKTTGLGVGKTILSSGAAPDIPLRHLKLSHALHKETAAKQQDTQTAPVCTSSTSHTAYGQPVLQLQEKGVQVSSMTC